MLHGHYYLFKNSKKEINQRYKTKKYAVYKMPWNSLKWTRQGTAKKAYGVSFKKNIYV